MAITRTTGSMTSCLQGAEQVTDSVQDSSSWPFTAGDHPPLSKSAPRRPGHGMAFSLLAALECHWRGHRGPYGVGVWCGGWGVLTAAEARNKFLVTVFSWEAEKKEQITSAPGFVFLVAAHWVSGGGSPHSLSTCRHHGWLPACLGESEVGLVLPRGQASLGLTHCAESPLEKRGQKNKNLRNQNRK